MNQRPSLTVSFYGEGVRCYVKTSDGLVRELCRNVSSIDFQTALQKKDLSSISQSDQWFLGELKFQTHPQSTIICHIDEGWHKSVFYQDTAGVIRERRHAAKGSDYSWPWHVTAFAQDIAIPGTSLAVVPQKRGNYTEGFLLLYQGLDDTIYLRVTKDKSSEWGKRLRRGGRSLVGRPLTGIAALDKEGTEDIVLFFQDKDGQLCECLTSVNGKRLKCTPVSNARYHRTLRNIAAVTLVEGEMRVYIQDDSLSILEWIKLPKSKAWTQGDLNIPAPSDATFTAIAQHGKCVQLLLQYDDAVVRQRVWFDGKWMDEQQIFYNMTARDITERWTGGVPDSMQKESETTASATTETLEGIPAFPISAPDGDGADDIIVLRVEDRMLMVRRTVLSQSSALFRDMFSIPRPPEELSQEDVYEGCPVVPLQDSAVDIVLLLRVLHNGHVLSSCDAHAYITLLDLASKYQTWGLLPRLLAVLWHEYPTNRFALIHLSHSTYPTQIDVCPLSGFYTPTGFTTLPALDRLFAVAPRAGVPALAASASLLGCLHSATLPSLLPLQKKLIESAEPAVNALFGDRCTRAGGCALRGVDALRAAVIPEWVVARGGMGLCAGCVAGFWERVVREGAAVGEGVWRAAEGMLGMGTWEKMERGTREVLRDVWAGRV